MPTVLRTDGLRVVIYLDDHAPAHVHVIGDGETKVAIPTGEVIRVVRAPARETRRAAALVREHRDYLQRCWDAIHG